MTLPYLSRGLGISSILLMVGACSADEHRLGGGDDPLGKAGKAGASGASGSTGSGGSSGSASGGTGGTDPCEGQSFPKCAPQCAGGFDIAGTQCTPGDACTISNFGDECFCDASGTWSCAVHPPLGPGCNKVCEYDTSNLKWFTTCGDPVCQTPDADDPTIPNCTTEQVGAACTSSGTLCEVPGDSCGTGLLCTDTDPTASGCPISRARHKDDIDYLDQRELEAVKNDFLRMRMATWRYKSEPTSAKPHLGFIIDDQPGSPAVMQNGERVDLYGYTSMAAATIQVQQKQIDALQRELKALRETVDKSCRK